MAEVVIHMAVSLDGYIAGPGGDLSWLIEDPGVDFEPFISAVEVLLMGRHTYETALRLGPWPYGELPVEVFTSQPDFPIRSPNTRVCQRTPAEWVEGTLPDLEGSAWVVGGAPLVAAFLELDAVERMYLGIHPVVLGGGSPLFLHGTSRLEFRLVSVDSLNGGLILVQYERVRAN